MSVGTCRYPHCLFFLDMLQVKGFRDAIAGSNIAVGHSGKCGAFAVRSLVVMLSVSMQMQATGTTHLRLRLHVCRKWCIHSNSFSGSTTATIGSLTQSNQKFQILLRNSSSNDQHQQFSTSHAYVGSPHLLRLWCQACLRTHNQHC